MKGADARKATAKIQDLQVEWVYIIGKEIIKTEENNKYFELFFLDTKLLYIQPIHHFKTGILMLDAQGELNLLDNAFNAMPSSSYFSYERGNLYLSVHEEQMQEDNLSSSSFCLLL